MISTSFTQQYVGIEIKIRVLMVVGTVILNFTSSSKAKGELADV